MANTKVIVIPEGKICDYVDGKFRNDTPEEYVRQILSFLIRIVLSRHKKILKSSSNAKKKLLKHEMPRKAWNN